MEKELDFIANGQAHGSVAQLLMANNFDYRVLRPYIAPEDGKSYRTVVNAAGEESAIQIYSQALLRKDEWVELDKNIITAANLRAKMVNDAIARGLSYNLSVGLAATVLQSQKMGKIGAANLGMTGLEETNDETPAFDLDSLPLPIAHMGVGINLRMLQASRQGGQPLDMTLAQMAGQAVGEMIERLYIGTAANYQFGGMPIYGLVNFPTRLTKDLSDWSLAATTGVTIQNEVLAMIGQLQAEQRMGPYLLYVSPDFARGLERDYNAYGTMSILGRLLQIRALSAVVDSDFMPTKTAVMVQASTDTVRIVTALAPQTIQWEEKGGLLTNIKAMAVQVPQIRADYYGKVGVCHGSVPTSS